MQRGFLIAGALCGFVAALAVIGCGEERVTARAQLQERNGVFYAVNQAEPLTGEVVAQYENGQVASAGSYTNGQLDGVQTTWHENGQIASEVSFTNGKIDGKWTCWGVSGEPVKSAGIKMVRIPAGSFMMGSPPSEEDRFEDETRHRVTLTRDFWLAATEVTQGQWELVTGQTPSSFKGRDRPVENVSWNDAVAFCNRLSIYEGLVPAYRIGDDDVVWDKAATGYRLPTEAEWEYACRAGAETPFHFGATLNIELANFDGYYPFGPRRADPGRQETRPVGFMPANAWGLHEVHGNVWEWCWDWLGEYPGSVTDPSGPTTGLKRVRRGGSWNAFSHYCRSANRFYDAPDIRYGSLGLRPASWAP